VSSSLLTANDTPGEYPPSYYAATANAFESFPPAAGELSCDVCVIGGGYTGLSTALHAAERGLDTILIEANRVGWGASGRNGGQVGTGQRIDQDDLEKMVGDAKAKQLWGVAEDAKALVRSLVQEHGIQCDLKHGYIHADHRERFVQHSWSYAEKLRKDYDYDQIEPLNKSELRDHLDTAYYHGGTIDRGAMHLHPLNYALGLADAARRAGVRIFERSPVASYADGARCTVRTEQATISAGHVVLACNGYLESLDRRVASKAMPINNFIIATEPLDENLAQSLIRDDTSVSDSKFVVNYYRLSADRRLLFGGGENYSYQFPNDIKSFVRPHMLQVYPQLSEVKIDYGWGGTLAITVNRFPHFARLSQNVLTASGYSGHGVAMATMAGKILADAIAGTEERLDLMASIPTLSFPGGAVMRWPLLVLAMTYYSLRDRL